VRYPYWSIKDAGKTKLHLDLLVGKSKRVTYNTARQIEPETSANIRTVQHAKTTTY